MPIRMEKDPEQPSRDDHNVDDEKRKKGGGGLTSLLPFLLAFMFKNPKLLMPVLLIGGIFYFMGGFNLFTGGNDELIEQLFMGCTLDEQKFDKAQV